MPRDWNEVHRRLQTAALELYQSNGFESTTAAEIAAKAGVTERTFFRHFADKREILFAGEALLTAALTNAIHTSPPELGPWETLQRAFRSAEQLFVENRAFSEPRRHIIANSPTLVEREQAKIKSLIVALASALAARGVPSSLANLAAQIGMATLVHAFTSWLESPGSFDEHVVRAFSEVRELSAPSNSAQDSSD